MQVHSRGLFWSFYFWPNKWLEWCASNSLSSLKERKERKDGIKNEWKAKWKRKRKETEEEKQKKARRGDGEEKIKEEEKKDKHKNTLSSLKVMNPTMSGKWKCSGGIHIHITIIY
jgi:hypothetical protein